MNEKLIKLENKDINLELHAFYNEHGMKVENIEQAVSALYLIKKEENKGC